MDTAPTEESTQAAGPGGRIVGLVVDERFELHDTGPGHSERAERLRAVRGAIEAEGLDRRCTRVEPAPADDALLTRVHDPEHVRRVAAACAAGRHLIDSMDTAICAESDRIARLAAGSVTELALRVARGGLRRGFSAVRPPGHHAERDLAMGFCLYNNVAVAAAALRAEGVERVLIVDWDVHHGNGTQHLFEDDPNVFYFSVHQWPLYPGTGAHDETGVDAGVGATLNCPLPPGSGDGPFLSALRDALVPAAERFRPEFVLVSAGFDAHRRDPLANLNVSTEAYGEATAVVVELAERLAGGRLVSVLEGGYDLDALGESVAIHLRGLIDHR